MVSTSEPLGFEFVPIRPQQCNCCFFLGPGDASSADVTARAPNSRANSMEYEVKTLKNSTRSTPFSRLARGNVWMFLFSVNAVMVVMFLDCAVAATSQETDLLALLKRMEASYAKVQDYSAIFRKHERVKGVLLPEESIYLKFKKPLQIYMKWVDGPTKEAIYVEGSNKNRVIAHTGAGLTWNLDPNGSILIAGNRHAITDIGFGFILKVMNTNFHMAIKNAEIEITRMGEESYEGRPAIVVEAKFSSGGGREYYATRMVCHIDKEYLLPVGIACYDEKDALMEEYAYKDVKINIGLTDMDFSRENKEYDF